MARDPSRMTDPPKKTRAEREAALRKEIRTSLTDVPAEELEGMVQMEIEKEIEQGKIADASDHR
jgi:hypothetical protein